MAVNEQTWLGTAGGPNFNSDSADGFHWFDEHHVLTAVKRKSFRPSLYQKQVLMEYKFNQKETLQLLSSNLQAKNFPAEDKR